MSIKAMTYVWENYKKGGAKKLLYLALADAANDRGYCWPGIKTLMKKCNVSRRYVQKLLRELEDAEEIRVLPQVSKSGRILSNRYILSEYLAAIGEQQDTSPENGDVNHSSPTHVNYSSPTHVNYSSPKPLKEPSKQPSKKNQQTAQGPTINPAPVDTSLSRCCLLFNRLGGQSGQYSTDKTTGQRTLNAELIRVTIADYGESAVCAAIKQASAQKAPGDVLHWNYVYKILTAHHRKRVARPEFGNLDDFVDSGPASPSGQYWQSVTEAATGTRRFLQMEMRT